jgi:hypothetical protein
LALSVPLSRFTPRVGGGSAFFVRHRGGATTSSFTIFTKKDLLVCFVFLDIYYQNPPEAIAVLAAWFFERR